MNVTKRNGTKEEFDIIKIINVLHKASKTIEYEIDSDEIRSIADDIVDLIGEKEEILSTEIQSAVERVLIEANYIELAKAYIIACYEKAFQRNISELDKSILDVISNQNKEVSLENSNKDSSLVTTQRDYIAGEVSKNIARRLIFPKDVIEAHDKGIIHVHDMDYSIQNINNCGLVNLEDMFTNGTMVGNVLIDTPKSLRTASTVATQVVASVASSQYGGQTISLAHLAPYVNISREKYRNEILEELSLLGKQDDTETLNYLVEKRVLKEIKDSIQTINYQLNSFNTTNGQTPFISIFIALCEAKNEQEKHDLALLSAELFKQRIKGMKNKDGVYVTQTFPKLIYVLEEDNIHEESPYWELTKLAAKCTAKRMVPDYMSAKKLMEIKKAIVPVMGCVDYNETVTIKMNGRIKNISIGDLYKIVKEMKNE